MLKEVFRYADWYWWMHGVNIYELLKEKNEKWVSTTMI